MVSPRRKPSTIAFDDPIGEEEEGDGREGAAEESKQEASQCTTPPAKSRVPTLFSPLITPTKASLEGEDEESLNQIIQNKGIFLKMVL